MRKWLMICKYRVQKHEAPKENLEGNVDGSRSRKE
jgi:hypothetical protein